MQLTRYTDYALRVLMYVGIHTDRMVTIAEVAAVFDMSHNHLMKVVQELSAKGYVRSTRGKHGGIELGRPPEEVNIGEVVRLMESNFHIVECFDPGHSACRIIPGCTLKKVLQEAALAFQEVLNRYTLADLLKNRTVLNRLLTERRAIGA
ncbi:Rrf2 family transcriptional regulator [Methylocaldum sp.]|uniref:Rrf2 family transcriptional regulator n=1 Tax=Methylocaldum sp. TaxID=1969727 RepID=UPI002D6E6A50|nr:Rrf2 family transcriptional regulator [Methylocaldum sp.]HYE34469.1 Rrf2 family transcriptional regulator [Methylocaldum sp.]